MPIHLGDRTFESDDSGTAFDKAVRYLVQVKGFTENTARAIVGKVEQNIKKAQASANIPELYEEGGKRYARFFLINSDWNGRNWRVTEASIPQNIQTFEGMPYISEPNLEHFGMNSNTPVSEVLAKQEQYSAGPIIKVGYDQKKGEGFAIVEIQKDRVWKELQNGEAIYVSPAVTGIANMDEMGRATYDVWHGLHLARVKVPAYGVMVASIKETCEGPGSTCINRLFASAVASGLIKPCQFHVATADIPSSSYNIHNSTAYQMSCPEGEEMMFGKCVKKERKSVV